MKESGLIGLDGPNMELPNTELGGCPAGVNELAEDGGGPAGVVEGFDIANMFLPLPDRLSGVEGAGLEE